MPNKAQKKPYQSIYTTNKKNFRSATSLQECFSILLRTTGVSVNQLARLTQIPLSTVEKIRSGKTKNPAVRDLVALCLVFRLNFADCKFVLSWAERTFKPSERQAYKAILQHYATQNISYELSEHYLDAVKQISKQFGFVGLV